MTRRATKAELRQEIAELRHVGNQMSNICFNWAQEEGRFRLHEREMLDQMRRNWDAIKRREGS